MDPVRPGAQVAAPSQPLPGVHAPQGSTKLTPLPCSPWRLRRRHDITKIDRPLQPLELLRYLSELVVSLVERLPQAEATQLQRQLESEPRSTGSVLAGGASCISEEATAQSVLAGQQVVAQSTGGCRPDALLQEQLDDGILCRLTAAGPAEVDLKALLRSLGACDEGGKAVSAVAVGTASAAAAVAAPSAAQPPAKALADCSSSSRSSSPAAALHLTERPKSAGHSEQEGSSSGGGSCGSGFTERVAQQVLGLQQHMSKALASLRRSSSTASTSTSRVFGSALSAAAADAGMGADTASAVESLHDGQPLAEGSEAPVPHLSEEQLAALREMLGPGKWLGDVRAAPGTAPRARLYERDTRPPPLEALVRGQPAPFSAWARWRCKAPVSFTACSLPLPSHAAVQASRCALPSSSSSRTRVRPRRAAAAGVQEQLGCSCRMHMRWRWWLMQPRLRCTLRDQRLHTLPGLNWARCKQRAACAGSRLEALPGQPPSLLSTASACPLHAGADFDALPCLDLQALPATCAAGPRTTAAGGAAAPGLEPQALAAGGGDNWKTAAPCCRTPGAPPCPCGAFSLRVGAENRSGDAPIHPGSTAPAYLLLCRAGQPARTPAVGKRAHHAAHPPCWRCREAGAAGGCTAASRGADAAGEPATERPQAMPPAGACKSRAPRLVRWRAWPLLAVGACTPAFCSQAAEICFLLC